jgi:hypothetical protein
MKAIIGLLTLGICIVIFTYISLLVYGQQQMEHLVNYQGTNVSKCEVITNDLTYNYFTKIGSMSRIIVKNPPGFDITKDAIIFYDVEFKGEIKNNTLVMEYIKVKRYNTFLKFKDFGINNNLSTINNNIQIFLRDNPGKVKIKLIEIDGKRFEIGDKF